ncbi:MAG: VOC family protein [Actinomycetota bacterium]|nr:VOC family protein [Actinomycetota bacterium]
MIAWYAKVFEARVQHGDERLTFMTYDDEHHRFAFANLGPLPEDGPAPRMGKGVGVNHLAYTWSDLAELVDLYKRLKADGIVPVRPIRHGITLSMYYADPDGSLLEFQIDVLDPDAANAFMEGPAFAANPIGEKFDPDALVAALDEGLPIADFVFRSDQEAAPFGAR